MTESTESLRGQMEIRISETIGGGHPAVAYALSFHPNPAEKFIAIQAQCAEKMGGKGFWFMTDKGWKGRNVLPDISEAYGILKLEDEVNGLRGNSSNPDFYNPHVDELQKLVETYDTRNIPLADLETFNHEYQNMRRKALEKLGVTEDEITTAKEYLATHQNATEKESKANLLKTEMEKLLTEASTEKNTALKSIKDKWKR